MKRIEIAEPEEPQETEQASERRAGDGYLSPMLAGANRPPHKHAVQDSHGHHGAGQRDAVVLHERQETVAINAPHMTAIADDPSGGCPSYSADLNLKPDFTFALVVDPQFDRETNRDYLIKKAEAAIAELNVLNPAMVFVAGGNGRVAVEEGDAMEWKRIPLATSRHEHKPAVPTDPSRDAAALCASG